MLAVLVTGSRKWNDRDAVVGRLADLQPAIVIHGAATGADSFAAEWAMQFRNELAMPAQWGKHGKAAGPMRNMAMLNVAIALRECGWEVRVLAFPLPDSVGTVNMMHLAREAGFEVIEVRQAEA